MDRCRACHSEAGQVVLDLGKQPASDDFPRLDDPGPDETYPLQMWLCASCGLAQLLSDPTIPAEPKGNEPVALVEQAADAVARVAAEGWLKPGMRLAEFGSPHGGSWAEPLERRGVTVVAGGADVDVVLDCFGLMHEASQSAALANRAALIAPGGTILLQYHSLATILRLGQWNSLRHGHYAYYSTTALVRMLAAAGFAPRSAWTFDLYGGTVLLAATRSPGPDPDSSVVALLDDEQKLGVLNASSFRDLQHGVVRKAGVLRDWLKARHGAGATVVGYGAASRAVALLCHARVDSRLLSAIADASSLKHGRRMPGTDIPIISPEEMISGRVDYVVLLIPELRTEVRARFPELEIAGGRWISIDELAAGAA